jgi:hypothetical protein
VLDPYEKWYKRAFNQFNINRFVFERANAFFYTRDDNTKVRLRDVHIWSMDDVDWVTRNFLAGKKFNFYCTTERYDWTKIPPHPTRFDGHKEWRNNIFKPAQEKIPGFIKGKDAVFELDCAGGHKRVADDWEKGIAVARKIVDTCKSLGIREMWADFSGSGGLHLWVPWEQLLKFHADSEYAEAGLELVALGEFAKKFVADVALLSGAFGGPDKVLFIDGITVDISPNTRRGLIRCPYSLHPKTNNVVYPFDKKEFEELLPVDITTKFSVNYVLSHRELKNRGVPDIL